MAGRTQCVATRPIAMEVGTPLLLRTRPWCHTFLQGVACGAALCFAFVAGSLWSAPQPQSALRTAGSAEKLQPISKGSRFRRLVFHDEFDEFDLSVWKHDITMGGGGNWEFQVARFPCLPGATPPLPPHIPPALRCTPTTARIVMSRTACFTSTPHSLQR